MNEQQKIVMSKCIYFVLFHVASSRSGASAKHS